jgi:alkanesulfonate monooxygenase SsuD/methylene tetrahydromethanopterin reductase-like flavin-dependent oxidoreductase (luciferase family)
MHFGLNLPNGGMSHDPRTMAEFARLAEAAGWDGVFLEDYVVWQSHEDIPTFDPWITLAAMAMTTERIRLGTMVTPLPRRRPWQVARQTVTLDHLSKGRVILGVGVGDTPFDIGLMRLGEERDSKRRARMLDEALELLVGFWSGKPFSHDGEFYHVDQITLLPQPAQTPRIPIWIGGIYPRRGPIRRAARWDGACLYKADGSDLTAAEVSDLLVAIHENRASSAPFDIAVGGRHRKDDWEAERAHIQSVAEAGVTWWIEYLPPNIGTRDEIRGCINRGPLRIDG